MTSVAGRQVEVGIAIEASAGTPLAPTKWLQWDSFSFQAVAEKELFQSARGIRNKISNSKTTRRYGKGAIEFSPTPETLPYILALAMGSISTGAHSGEAAVYDHTFTINNTNGSMKTATITQKEGGIVTEQASNVVCDSWEIKIGKGFASVSADLVGNFPNTASGSSSYARETLFVIGDVHAYFGSSISAALGTQASTTLTSDTTAPADGATIVIGDRTYTAKSTLTGAPYEVFINTTAANFLANLKKAINGTGTEGTDYGYGTLPHPRVMATTIAATTLLIVAKAPGTQDNSIATTQAGTSHCTWPGVTMNSGTPGTGAAESSIFDCTITHNNNVQVDDAFRSGNSGYPTNGAFTAGPLEIKGSYTMEFTDTVELAKYRANTLNSLVLVINGAVIGTTPVQEQIIIKLGKLVLTKEPQEFSIDGTTMIKQEFEVQYDATDKEMTIVVTNLVAGTDY